MSDLFGEERDFTEDQPVAVLTTEPLDRMLDYRAPMGGVNLGALVEVPLGPRRVLGCVWGPGLGGFDRAKLRSIARVLDEPPIPAPMRVFLERAADYTITPLNHMLRLATRAPGLMNPPGDTKVLVAGEGLPDRMTPAREKVLALVEEYGGLPFQPGELASMAGVSGSVIKGLVAQGCLVEVFAPRDGPFPRLDPSLPSAVLNDEQTLAATQLRRDVAGGTYGTTLLKGVTGSGKTEVYLEAVAEALRLGQQALVLLPEIALSVEFMARVEKRFGARPAEWHSGVTMAERRRTWKAVARGQAQLVVGARSALFLPFQNLGLIVVDEEHDGSYKQEDGVHYHARDMGVLRASILGAQVVLASATPSLESWANAQAGKYARLDLAERFGVAEMPELRAIDMRAEKMEPNSWISPTLSAAVNERLAAGEQSLLFLNRRGFAPLTLCRACGHQIGCAHCDARMVEHRFLARLVCHQCGESRPIPEACPSCAVEGKLAPIGPGVERLAEEVEVRFPDARIALLSSDMAGSTRAMKARILEIAQGGADIIIGTQMVAKGHNFPLLTLVGVIDADLGLEGGDLRAAEKSFQLIRQVAGRAGRADRPGQALIQSHQPDHPLIKAIIAGDEEAFWAAEAANRARAGVPPYGRMAGIVLSGPDEAQVYMVAREMAQAWAGRAKIDAQLFGPAAAPVARIRGRHRVRMLIKAPKGAPIQDALRRWVDGLRLPNNMRLTIDIDPQSFY